MSKVFSSEQKWEEGVVLLSVYFENKVFEENPITITYNDKPKEMKNC